MNHTFPAVAPKPPHRTWVLHACQIAVVLILAAETSHARADEAADDAWPPANQPTLRLEPREVVFIELRKI